MQRAKRWDVVRKGLSWTWLLAILAGLHACTYYNYLVFHSIVEVFAIVVACGIFMLAWNSRQISSNHFLLFLGVAYLFVAVLDLVHTMAYEGVAIFPNQTVDLATRLWIGARYMEAVSLLIAPMVAHRRMRPGAIFAGFAGVTALLLVFNLAWPIFPTCFDPETGLTTFKKVSEYIISGLLIAAVAVLWRRRAQFDRYVWGLMVASILLTVASELSFTLYRHAYDIANEVGHLLKLVSFYLIYRAVIETGIRKPYAVLLRDLKESNQILESKNRELLRFASIVRHDLGNPLFSVEVLAKCITRSCDKASETVGGTYQELEDELRRILSEEIPESVDLIQDSVEVMKKLLDGLRQVTAVGHVPMHIDRVDMNKLLQQITSILAPKAQACGAAICVDELPVCAGDVSRLNEVFGNLLDNAIKYLDPRRRGEIRISGRSEDGTNVYCVEDNGVGIAPEQQAKVFDVFHRVHPGGAIGGEGLGLFIVRQLVERHRGRIWVESELGRGSRFFVSLPAVTSQIKAIGRPSSQSSLVPAEYGGNLSAR